MVKFNKILQWLQEGVSEDEALAILGKSSSGIYDKIKKYLLGGWGVGQILNIFAKDPEVLDKLPRNFKPASPADIARISILKGKMGADKSQDEQALAELKGFTSKALQAGAAISSIYGPQKLASNLLGIPFPGLSQEQPSIDMKPPIPPNPMGGSNDLVSPEISSQNPIQPPQALIQTAKQPTQNVPVPTPNQSIQSPFPEQQPLQGTIPISPSDVIRRTKLDSVIESMGKDKISPEQIGEYISQSYPDHASYVEEQTKEPLVNSIYRYLGKKQKAPKLIDELHNQFNKGYPSGTQSPIPQSQSQNIDQVQSPESVEKIQDGHQGKIAKSTEKAKIQNSDVVSLPDGQIGIIEEIKKDHAVVDVNGKKRPVKLEEIEQIPISQKDLADLHEELINGIEKETGQQVSRNVNWAGYEPDTNRLAYLPHDGAFYIYDDISPEDAKELTNLLTKRKTTGENFIGAWEKGTESPIGAAMSALIQRLQRGRGGKGKEYSGKFQTVYSAYEPAVKAAKQKRKKK